MNTLKKELEQLNNAEKQALNIPDVMRSYRSKAQKRKNKSKKMRKKFEKRRKSNCA